ncbi:MAG: hypothetical protein WCK51_15205 [Armatimonadota bacterium]
MNTHQRRIYDTVFQRPLTHNLGWRDVKSLAATLGTVEVEHNGNAKVTVGGKVMVFHSPAESDILTVEQVMELRHLLEGVEQGPPEPQDFHSLVVMNHSGARIYRMEVVDTTPEKVEAYDPSGQRHHVHTNHDYFKNSERANQNEFFSSVAEKLAGADRIIIFGSGEGSSNAMARFTSWLKQHNELLFSRIVKTQKIDESHTTEAQLLLKAREIYAD